METIVKNALDFLRNSPEARLKASEEEEEVSSSFALQTAAVGLVARAV